MDSLSLHERYKAENSVKVFCIEASPEEEIKSVHGMDSKRFFTAAFAEAEMLQLRD
jgi:hypothetical protein